LKHKITGQRARHERDPYVRQARDEGYRSRAAYKLLELDRRYRLLRPGMRVLELGAAPGGWTQVAVRAVGSKGRVVCIDILPMQPVSGAMVIEGDFTDPGTQAALSAAMDGAAVDLVLSDLAPNISGISPADQARSIALVESVLDLARKYLCSGGNLLAKIFQGEGLDELIDRVKADFERVQRCKPRASKGRSRELYLLARSYKQSV
jgi:23S rRNA (uridine2552-2'-O)-methyltransferase